MGVPEAGIKLADAERSTDAQAVTRLSSVQPTRSSQDGGSVSSRSGDRRRARFWGLPLPATEVPTRDARLPYGGALISGCTQQVAVLTMGTCRGGGGSRAGINPSDLEEDGSMTCSSAAESVWVRS